MNRWFIDFITHNQQVINVSFGYVGDHPDPDERWIYQIKMTVFDKKFNRITITRDVTFPDMVSNEKLKNILYEMLEENDWL